MSIREDFEECFGIKATNTQSEGEALAEAEWDTEGKPTMERSESEFINFYTDSKGYIHELVNWNDSARKKRIRPKVHRTLVKYFPSAKNILDFGGGTGDDAFYLHKLGYNLSHFDINKEMTKFAKFRANKYGIGIKFIDSLDEIKFVEVIMFLDVIEHLHDPFKYLKIFSEKCDAMLFTQAFGIHGDDGKQFPYHTDYKMKDIKNYLEKELDFKKVHIPVKSINTPPHLYKREK